MNRLRSFFARSILAIVVALIAPNIALSEEPAEKPVDGKQTIRCAVIGGMVDTGLWSNVARRFEEKSGHKVQVVAAGNKHVIVPAMKRGEADLLTMHASDAVINLVADGYAQDPQPWTRNDQVIVGPADDPAGIRSETDAVKAIQKIIESKNKLLIHASAGTGEVLSELLATGELSPPAKQVIYLPSHRQRDMLKRASQENAYTLVGRIPFLDGKIPRAEMEIIVQGDPRLRRPFVVVVATGDENAARSSAARELAAFLRTPETQEWLKTFGKGTYDDEPLFFPVELTRPK